MPIRAQLFDGTVLEFPDGTDQSVIDRVARQETLKRQPQPEAAPATIEPPKKEGFGAALGKGIEGILSPSRTAIGALTGSAEEAALAGLKRSEESPYADQVSLDKVKQAYQRGLLPAAGEVLRQIPLAITEQAPNIAATLGSAKAGSLLGAKLGTAIAPGVGTAVGTIGGGIVGAVAPSLLQQFGGNIQRQAQEQLAAKQPVDISRTAAAAAAGPQAALDVAATFIPLGRTVAGSVLGPQVKQMLERGAKEGAEKLARESLPTVLAKGAGISIATEAPTEVIQSMLERAQAGLPLLSDDALNEYGEAAYQASLIAPIGSAARVGERSTARQQTLPPENRPGETDRQAAERIQAEILEMKRAAQPPAPGPILDTNNLYTLMAQPNGYGLVEQYKQRLLALPKQTPEIKEAIEAAAFIQNRANIEKEQRRTTKPAPEEVKDAGEAVTPPSGEGVQVAGEPDTGSTTEGVGATQPSGVVPPVEDAGQPAGGAEAQQPAITPEVEALQGSETRLILPDGKKLTANWEVIEADSVSAAMFEGRAQPRDRQRAASNAQVLAIANNPDFDRLSDTSQTMDYGAPTLTGEYVIVGGNGRFEGVNLSYDTEVGQAYKQNLISNAQRFGLDPAQVSGMKKPVLIRKIPGESAKPDDTRKLAIQSNIVPGLEMSDMERAALDSERMTNLQELDITDTGDIPLTTKNMGTIRDALKGYTKEELSGMLAADGSLSQSGLRRVKNAVLYKAYGKTDTLSRLLESPDADLKNVGTALMRASGSMSRLMDGIRSGAIPSDYDIIADLTGAVETLSALRASGTKVQDFISQSDMFGGGISNEAKTILTFLDQNLRSARSITEFLNDYASAAISAESAGDGLFGEVQLPSKQETIERAAQRPEAERAAAKAQQTIFEQPAGTPAEEGAAKPEGEGRPLEGGEGAVAKLSLRLNEAIQSVKSDIEAQIKDWSSRVYKANKKQVELAGDGPSRQASMSVSQINESKRRRAVEGLQAELKAVRDLEKQIADPEMAERLLNKSKRLFKEAQERVASGEAQRKDAGLEFEATLLSELGIRPPRGAYESNNISKAIRRVVETMPDEPKVTEQEAKPYEPLTAQQEEDVLGLFAVARGEPKKSLVEMRKRYEAARAAPASVETKPEPTELDKEIEAKIEELGRVLSRIMARFGLKDVALNLVEDMKAEGEYAQSVIRLALDAVSPVQALRHESIHALKELGFFTPQQWAALEKQAKSKWVDQYLKNVNINKEPLGEGEKSRYDAYSDLFKSQGLSDAAIEEAIREEAIADAFGEFDVNKAPAGMMQAILNRLRNFFDAIKTAFGGEVTAEQVFRKVEKGELKPGTVPQVNGQFERLSLSLPDDYRGEHKAPTKDSGSPAHDLSGVYPDDVYGPRGPQYYAHYADSRDLESFEIIRRVRNLPNVPITVYRAVPKSAPSVINNGDWVTISKKYAKEHGEGPLKGDYKIVNKLVHPRDIFTNGDSIHEWGYDPQPMMAREEAVSRGYKPSLRAPKTEAFKRWFGNSKVVDENGDPLVVYHYTASSEDFSKFATKENVELGSHFGTKEQILDLDDKELYQAKPRVLPVYLSIQNPIRLRDDGGFQPARVLRQLDDMGLLTERQYNALASESNEQKVNTKIRDFLIKAGYDGVVYINRREGYGRSASAWGDAQLFGSRWSDEQWLEKHPEGRDSYIAFKPTQIKSAIGNIGTFDATKPDIRYSLRDSIGLYSELENKVAQGPNKAPAASWKAYINGLTQKGVKPEEIEWSGVRDWLDLQTGPVSKDAVNAYLKQGGVKVEETSLGESLQVRELDAWLDRWADKNPGTATAKSITRGDAWYEIAAVAKTENQSVVLRLIENQETPAKYGQYQLPGGTNYREVLLTLPVTVDAETQRLLDEERYLVLGPEEQAKVDAAKKKAGIEYRSSHWDQPNVIAHIRLNDRTDAGGNKVLFVEEIQSDWGQEGKKKGFVGDLIPQNTAWQAVDTLDTVRTRAEAEAKLEELQPFLERNREPGMESRLVIREGDGFFDIVEENRSPTATAPSRYGVPRAPFVTKTEGWLNLALKRIMVMAAEGGYDKVAFVNGEQSANRYDLSKQVTKIEYASRESTQQEARALTVYGLQGQELLSKNVTERELPDLIGKETAERLLSADPKSIGGKAKFHIISGDGLKVGGEGMKTFYNQIVPLAVKKLLPKVGGGQMGDVNLLKDSMKKYDKELMKDDLRILGEEGFRAKYAHDQQPGFSVTPEMKQKVETTGLPRFSLRSTIPTATRQRIVQTTVTRDEKTFYQRIIEAISPSSFQSFRADALNRYDRLGVYDKKLAEKMGGKALLASSSAEAAALLSDLGAGLTASALGVHDRMGGIPVYRNGITIISNMNGTVKGPTAIFAPLAREPGDYQAYQYWAAVKRGMRLMYTIDPKTGESVERLITEADGPIAEALRKQYLKDFKIDFNAIQEDWIKYNNGLVDYMLATGVLSKERASLYKQYADYLPFYRQMNGEETVGPKIFQSIAGVKPPKKIKGGETRIDDFLENIVRNTQSAIQAGVKNIASKAAADVAVKIQMAERLDYQSTAPNVFHVYEDGKPVSYETADQLFINAIKSLGLPDLPFIGFLSGPANLLRNLVTKDPGFMLANLMRDSMSAWVTSGVKMTPMVDTIYNFGSAIAGKSPEFQALMNAGILGGYEFSQNVEQSGREFGKALRKQAKVRQPGMKGVLEMSAKPFTSLWDALEKGSTASDAATRIEIYKKTLAETGNEAEALYRALEVMNFNRKGSSAVIRILTAAVPFLNARMQGLDVLYRASTGNMNAVNAKQIQKNFFVRGAMIAALSTAYWALTHDDEEYKKQEQETRDNYWLLPSLGVKIPIPFEIGVLFKVIPERILGYTMGSDTGEDFLKSMARQLTSTLAFNPIPQTVLPVVESMTNFSFFTMRPIVGQGLEGLQPAYQVAPGTSRISEAIGSATKGLPKELQISPAKMDQLISGYTGTMGMYMVNLMDAIFDMNTDSPKPARRFEQMPLIRRFAIDPEARGSVTAYYELKNSVDSIVRTSNMLERTMNYEELPAYLQDNARMLATKDYLLDLEKTMKEFREMKIMIRSAKMSAEAKGDAIASIEKMENQLTANIQYLKSLAKGG